MQRTETRRVRTERKAGSKIRAWLETQPRPVTAQAIAEAGGFSRQYTSAVLAGRVSASERFLAACRSCGVPIHLLVDDDEDR